MSKGFHNELAVSEVPLLFAGHLGDDFGALMVFRFGMTQASRFSSNKQKREQKGGMLAVTPTRVD